jgi:long-chain acyl-CoA synthetase
MQLKIKNFSKWKEGLGGNLDLMVSGSAVTTRLAEFCRRIPVMEGYGLTKLPVISVNEMEVSELNCWKSIDNVDVKIAEDGETL